jgi:alkanesulfonate monooxygenase SsuD/methylene tetrahydromethanopterin reductase-like flavin-dependent oxidoreductase (luciferase family)
VKAGSVTVSERPEARDAGRAFIAYYIARMGSFYYDQLVRFGFEEDAALVKRTFEERGSAAAAEAIPTRLVEELGFAGSAEACRDRILEQERQGIDIHGISLDTREPRAFAKAVDTLLR